MKKIKFICMASIAALALSACSDDQIGEGADGTNRPGVEDGVFFSINIDMPKAPGMRSSTTDPGNNGSASDGGVEIGKEDENIIQQAVVVLARSSDNGFIAAATVSQNALHAISADKSAYKALSKFSKTQLSAYYSDKNFSEKVNIFVFANPNEGIQEAIFGSNDGSMPGPVIGSTDWVDAVQVYDSGNNIWTPKNFLMSNALIAQRSIPATLNEWDNYKTEGSPFDLSGYNTAVNIDNDGAIQVERAAARFDFRDGSEDGKNNKELNGIGNFTYNVVYDGVGEDAKTPLINIQLQRMAFVNMNKTFYALRHVSDDGTMMGASVCKPEKPWFYDQSSGNLVTKGNYVVDADQTWKKEVQTAWDNATPEAGSLKYDEHFEYPFFNNDNTIDNVNASSDRWGTSLCKEVVEKDEDNDDSWNDGSKGDYHIWRYATENVVAGEKGQLNSLTTGVVFKGKMIATSDALNSDDKDVQDLANTINNTSEDLGDSYKAPILYLFAGNLYMTWNKIREAAIKAAVPGFKWVANDTEEDGGHWEPYAVNRTNSLYVAVFGTGGFGSVTFQYNKVDGSGTVLGKEEITYTDELAEDLTSANKAWNNWNAAGKPSSGESKDAFKKAVTDAKITIYQRSFDNNSDGGWGYYCYYYYWNRHHDNGRPGIMGPMEFGVVRNNVYKLAVTKISRLGHPRISENDPDKPTPGTPDESEDIYLTVTAKTLPWVVRVNNIEF